ncbi:MAG: FAD-dependent monooxygenase [Solirubrobacterales bacterium]|nr:FAD-dependent monooxygenase [Solirubrobacterales bacterium]
MISSALIVGGGPAGMTAAIALAQRGVRCEIVERATDWRPAGIGIGLHSPPMRALRDLGVLEPLLGRSEHHTVIDMMRPDGVKVAEMPQMNVLGSDAPAFITMSRMTLHEVLEAHLRELGVPVRLGVTVSAVNEADAGAEVTASDGRTAQYELVVGADGQNSTMRPLLLPSAPAPQYAGQVIWRLDVRRPPPLERYTILIGRETRLGLVPIAADRAYVWMLDSTVGPERAPASQLLELLHERLATFSFVVPEIAAQITDPGQVDFRALHWLLVPPPWGVGNALLIGDAVHTTTPQMACGVGLAIEDAVVLAELVAEGASGPELTRRLCKRRFERCRLVVEGSLQLSRWEREPDSPGADPAGLIRDSFAALAAPI